MHIEVVADTFDAIEVKDDQDVETEAGNVDGNNGVPMHRTRKSTVYHHDQPRSERLVKEKFGIVLSNGFLCGEEGDNRNNNDMEIVLHLGCMFVYKIKYGHNRPDCSWQNEI